MASTRGISSIRIVSSVTRVICFIALELTPQTLLRLAVGYRSLLVGRRPAIDRMQSVEVVVFAARQALPPQLPHRCRLGVPLLPRGEGDLPPRCQDGLPVDFQGVPTESNRPRGQTLKDTRDGSDPVVGDPLEHPVAAEQREG